MPQLFPRTAGRRTAAGRLAALATMAAALALPLSLAAPAQAAEGAILGADSPQAIAGEYIVVFDSGEIAAETATGLIANHDGQIEYRYTSIDGFAVRMSEAEAGALAATDGVAYVAQNTQVTVDGTQQDPPSWGLDRIDQAALPLDGGYEYPDSAGSGVTAYTIDTGVDIGHPDFGSRARHGADFTGEGHGDGHGHGTHVSGTMAGAAFGVAKSAEIVAVKVLGAGGSGSTADVIAGVDWVTTNAEHPAVANMSLGGGANQALEDAVTASVNSGVVYSLAAGNDSGQDACGKSPAGAPGALTVAATNAQDARASFSNIGRCVNLFAPGVDITSALPGGGSRAWSGTSMAAPHVAGAAALVLGNDPTATPAQVNAAIEANAITGAVSDPGTGSPNKLLNTEFTLVPPGPSGTLSGTVTDSAGSPAPRVTVSVDGPVAWRTTTDADGRYRLRLPVGSYSATAGGGWYETKTATGIQVKEDQATTRDFSLAKLPTGVLKGKVADRASGAALPGATVAVTGQVGESVITDGNGTYSLTLPVGKYTATGTATLYHPLTTGTLSITAGKTTVADFALAANFGAVTGIAYSKATGKPLPGITIKLMFGPGGATGTTTTTDAHGRFRFDRVASGSWTLWATGGSGCFLTTTKVTVHDERTTTQDIRMNGYNCGS